MHPAEFNFKVRDNTGCFLCFVARYITVLIFFFIAFSTGHTDIPGNLVCTFSLYYCTKMLFLIITFGLKSFQTTRKDAIEMRQSHESPGSVFHSEEMKYNITLDGVILDLLQ